MEGAKDFYGRWSRPEAFVARLRGDPSISQENKDAILDFVEDLEANGYSDARLRKYISALRSVLDLAPEGFAFKMASPETVRAIQVAINRSTTRGGSPTEDWTRIGYKSALKAMLKFLSDPKAPPRARRETELSRLISTTPKRYKRKLPDELLSRGEVDALLRECQNERDRALIAVLYESGARVGEFGALRVKDFTDLGRSATLMLPKGKTGPRKIPLVESVGYLRSWLRVHPLAQMDGKGSRAHPDAPMWVKVEKRGAGRDGKSLGADGLDYHAIVSMLRKRARRAGIPTSKVNPHNFRHSRATECGTWMTEAVMCEYFGWIPGSDMPRTYIHLSGRDVNGVVLAHHGLKDEEADVPGEPKRCPACGEPNPPTAKYCNRCQWALDLQAAIALSDVRGGLDRDLDELLKQPGVLEGIVNGAKDRAKVLQILAKLAGGGSEGK